MKKLLLTIILFIVFIPSTIFAQEVESSKPTMYIREGCSHCAAVEAFLEENELIDEVNIMETYNNEENQAELDQWFERLSVPTNQMGVPFMVYEDGTKYLGGDTPIISYFSELFDIEITEEDTKLPTSSSDSAILMIGALVMLGVVGYGIYTIFSKED